MTPEKKKNKKPNTHTHFMYFEAQRKWIEVWDNWASGERHNKTDCKLKTDKLKSKKAVMTFEHWNKQPGWLMESPVFDVFRLGPIVSQCELL